MAGGRSKTAVTWPCVCAVAHEAAVAAPAERKREGIEQDGLAGAGLAGEDAQARPKAEIEPVDQDDVADRELDEHALSRVAGKGQQRRAPLARSTGPRPAQPGRRLEGLADPGALVLARLEAPALQQLIGVLVPGLSGKLWPSTAAAVCASRHEPSASRLGQALQRLLDWRVVWYLATTFGSG